MTQKKIAVFLKRYSIGKSSPVVCLLELLFENAKVDLFIEESWCTKTKILTHPNVRVIDLGGGDSPPGFFLRFCYKYFLRFFKRYDVFICFDPHGFLLCKEFFPKARVFYYSLELYFRDNAFNLSYDPEAQELEHAHIHSIRGLFIQSPEREQLFRKEYSLSASIPTFLLPVTYSGDASSQKTSYLRDKYPLIGQRKICIHMGGIQAYHSCIEIAEAFSDITDWVLVFHGYHFGPYFDELQQSIVKKNLIEKVFVSDDTFEELDGLDQVLASADAGICWYNNMSPNLATSGKSSGKISAYLRFGLPVIVNTYRCTLEAIQETECGLCVASFAEIPKALQSIETNYKKYSQNALNEYRNTYWFEKYKSDILHFLESH